MTEQELAAVVAGIAPVVRAYVAKAISDALEARPSVPGPTGDAGAPGEPGPAGPAGPAGAVGRDGRDGLPGVPGAHGEKGINGLDGRHGTDGVHGKNGADGLSFGDLSLLQEDDRTVVLRATRGDGVKELGRLTFPAEIYRGVYQDGKAYDRGDRVTWAGSEWHANETTTTKPGDGSKAWTLTVKRGRDGRDGIDAPGALPVISVGKR